MKRYLSFVVSASLCIALVGVVYNGIRTFQERWAHVDSTTILLRDSVRSDFAAISKVIALRKVANQNRYVVTAEDIALLRSYEQQQLLVYEKALDLSRTERQDLVDEIAMLIGLLAGFLALIGIGLPILNMTVSREELHQDRERYNDTIERFKNVPSQVKKVQGKIGQLQEEMNRSSVKLSTLDEALVATKGGLTQSLEIARNAEQSADRLPILAFQFKLGNALNKRLWEEMKKDKSQKKTLVYLLRGAVDELTTFQGDTAKYERFCPELRQALLQFASDFAVLETWFGFRQDHKLVTELNNAIAAVVEVDGDTTRFWKALDEMTKSLGAVVDSLELNNQQQTPVV